MPEVSDYFFLPTTSKTSEPIPTVVSADRAIGSTTLKVEGLEGWGNIFEFTTLKEDANGIVDPTTIQRFKGKKQDNTTIIDLEVRGGVNIGNVIGDKVAQLAEIGNMFDNNVGMLVEHNADGTHNIPDLPSITPNPSGSGGTPLTRITIDGQDFVLAQTINTSPWVAASETWRFSSYNADTRIGTYALSSSAIEKYNPGMRVKFDQLSVSNYGIVVGTSGTDLLLFTNAPTTSSAVSNKFYSYAHSPIGFPVIGANPYTFLSNNEGWEVAKEANISTAVNYATTGDSTLLTMDLGVGSWEIHFFAKATLTSVSQSQSTTLSPGTTLLPYGSIRTFLALDGSPPSTTAEDTRLLNLPFSATSGVPVEFHHKETVNVATAGTLTARARFDAADKVGLTLTFSQVIIRARSLLV